MRINLKPFGLFAAIAMLFAWVSTAQEKSQQQQPRKMFNFPNGALELREKQLLLRKRADGWQLCRVKRFVWQESLVVLQAEGKVIGLIREVDATDSRPVSEATNGMFVVLEVAPETFPAANQVKVDERLLKSFEDSDEVLVKAADVRTPSFSLFK